MLSAMAAEEVKVDVVLQWKDFLWSLEQLRHNEGFTTNSDRDWFRVNPIEVVLLACHAVGEETLATKALASRITLGMDDPSPSLKSNPRLFKRLVDILLRTLLDRNVTGPIRLRFVDGLNHICVGTRNQLAMFHVMLLSRIFPVSSKLLTALRDVNTASSISVQLVINGFHQELALRDNVLADLPGYQCQLVDDVDIQSFLSWQLQQCCRNMGRVHSSMTSSECMEVYRDQIGVCDILTRFEPMVAGLQSWLAAGVYSYVLEIITVLVLNYKQLDREVVTAAAGSRGTPALVAQGNVSPEEEDNAQMEADDSVGIQDEAVDSGVVSEAPVNPIGSRNQEIENSDNATLGDLVHSDNILEGVDQQLPVVTVIPAGDRCKELLGSMVQASQQVGSGEDGLVIQKLLELCLVVLARGVISESFQEVGKFLSEQLQILVVYASEGYLTQTPSKFICHLMEYISTSLENDRSIMVVLNSDLPNVFGPVFGVRSSSVSELVLEFASLSLYSKYQKELKKEGVASIFEAFRLIKPERQKLMEEMKEAQMLEAVGIAHSIVCEVLERTDAALRTSHSQEAGRNGAENSADDSQDIDRHSPWQWQPSVLDVASTSHACRADHGRSFNGSDRDGWRASVLVEMLRLACALVSSGENILYLFRSVVPKLIREVPSTQNEVRRSKLAQFFGSEVPKVETNIPWSGDRKQFLVQLFSLAADYTQRTHRSVFHLLAVAVPKLAAGLDHIKTMDDIQKWEVLDELLSVTREALKRAQSIDEFISHGFDIITDILPDDVLPGDIVKFARSMAQKYVTTANSSSLMLARLSFNFLVQKFPEDSSEVRRLMRALVKDGSRTDLRAVYRFCREEFADDRYCDLRRLVYTFASGGFSSRHLQALSDLIASLMNLCPARPKQYMSIDIEDREVLLLKHERKCRRLNALAAPILVNALDVFGQSSFSRERVDQLTKDVSNLALFSLICQDLLEAEVVAVSEEDDAHEVACYMRDNFPKHVVEDADSQAFLQSYVSRLESMQIPRYSELQKLLKSILRDYLATAKEHHSLSKMQTYLSSATQALPRNVAARARLMDCGYSEKIWDGDKFIVEVTTDGTLSLEENLRQNLLRCYDEYAELLKLLQIRHVEVSGEQEKVVDLFDDRLSLPDLRGRRAIAARCIDQHLSKNMNEIISHRKLTLLGREEQLELEYEKQLNVATSPKHFTVALNTSLFDCSLCCGRQIIGCYAPTGDHSERPLEIGLREDSAVASIYDDKGLEIENVELLFADEGVIVYKAYSNGHPYDTSQVWGQFFQALLAEPALVPGLIVPAGFPNTQTWILLQRVTSPVETGIHINCNFDFCSEWRTYLDKRPERIRCGVDILLLPNFSISTGAGERLQRQMSVVSKDLAGLVFTDLMRVISNDDELREFRFLGKALAQSVSAVVSGSKEGPRDIISASFQYSRYASAAHVPQEQLLTKEAIVDKLAALVMSYTVWWCVDADAAEMYARSRGNFFDLKHFLESLKARKYGFMHEQHITNKIQEVHTTLNEFLLIINIGQLAPAAQEEVMRWIFANEDRVWRYRGGRDRQETLDQYFNFLPHRRKVANGEVCFPGVLTMCLRNVRAEDWKPENFQVGEVVAYAIGEFVSLDESGRQAYEIVTAFVQPQFRGLKLAVRMYTEACINSNCSYLLFDMVEGSFERIVNGNTFLLALERSGLMHYMIKKRQLSYEVMDQTGSTEQFEMMLVNAWCLRMSLHSYRAAGWLHEHPSAAASLMMLPSAVALGAMWLLQSRR